MNHSFPIRLVVFSSILVASAGAQTLHFNRHWWESAADPERDGFFWGYLDSPCAPVISAPYMEVNKFLDGYFHDHPNVTVPSALQVAAHKMKPWKPLPGGEVWRDAHGFMDGGWWGDTAHGEQKEQRGYVEGYLACKHQPVRDGDVQFYVIGISKYYDSPRHEHTKIAYVIEPMLDQKRAH